MNVSLSMPEILVICGTAMVVTSTSTWGAITLVSLGILSAFARYAIAQNDKKEAQEKMNQSVDELKKSAAEFAGLFSTKDTSDTIN